MRFERSCRQAYMAAGTAMLASVDMLIAVWDRRPAPRRGGPCDEAQCRGAAGAVGIKS